MYAPARGAMRFRPMGFRPYCLMTLAANIIAARDSSLVAQMLAARVRDSLALLRRCATPPTWWRGLTLGCSCLGHAGPAWGTLLLPGARCLWGTLGQGCHWTYLTKGFPLVG
jgi:hypothetical protein